MCVSNKIANIAEIVDLCNATISDLYYLHAMRWNEPCRNPSTTGTGTYSLFSPISRSTKRKQGFLLISDDDGRIIHYQPIGSFQTTEPFEISFDVDANGVYKFIYMDEGGDGSRQRQNNGDGEVPGYAIYVEGEILVSSEAGKYFLFAEHVFYLSSGEVELLPPAEWNDGNVKIEEGQEATSLADCSFAECKQLVWIFLHFAIVLAA